MKITGRFVMFKLIATVFRFQPQLNAITLKTENFLTCQLSTISSCVLNSAAFVLFMQLFQLFLQFHRLIILPEFAILSFGIRSDHRVSKQITLRLIYNDNFLRIILQGSSRNYNHHTFDGQSVI